MLVATPAIVLRARCAMSGTDVGHAATRSLVDSGEASGSLPAFVLRKCYAMSGTDRGYRATICCTDIGCHATHLRCGVRY
eukprot:1317728-Rhodomonas_salina.3